MRILLTNAAAAAAVAALLVLIPSRPATELFVQPESKLWVEGTSTIKSFTCKVPEFALKVSGDGAVVTDVRNAHKAVQTAELTLASPGIDCGSGALRVIGSYEFALSAFDLERPSLMFGRIKVVDKVQVKLDLILKN